jgi:hypothetical protein
MQQQNLNNMESPQWARCQESCQSWSPHAQPMDMMLNQSHSHMMNQPQLRVVNLPPTTLKNQNQNYRQYDPLSIGGHNNNHRTVNLPPVNLRNQNF